MSKPLRTQGGEGAIWKVFTHKTQHNCMECGCKDGLGYIGFAKNYTPGLSAKLYHCNDCGAWVDAIWPKALGAMLESETATV